MAKRKTKNIFKRTGSPNYWIRYTINRKQIRESTEDADYKNAELLLAKRISEGKIPTIKRAAKHTFRDLAEKYLLWTNGRQRSAKTKGYVIGQLVSVFSDTPLRGFNNLKVEQLQTNLISQGYKVASINKIMNIMKHMFSKATEWELIGDDVLKSIRKVKSLKGENKRLRYLSRDECRTLINSCEPHLKPIVITALHTGMRKSEILKLRWDQVDLKHGFILLDKTKNGERREIPINETLRSILQSLTRRLDILYVFYDSVTGNPYKDVKRSFGTALKRVELIKCPDCRYQMLRVRSKEAAGYCPHCKGKLTELRGIEDFHFHDLRHTFGSHLIMSGIDLATVKELLGHKDIKMTLRYAHLAPEHKLKAVNILDRTLNENPISTKLAQSGG